MEKLKGKCGSPGDQVEGNGAESGDERGRGKKGNLFHLVFFWELLAVLSNLNRIGISSTLLVDNKVETIAVTKKLLKKLKSVTMVQVRAEVAERLDGLVSTIADLKSQFEGTIARVYLVKNLYTNFFHLRLESLREWAKGTERGFETCFYPFFQQTSLHFHFSNVLHSMSLSFSPFLQ